MGTVLFWNIAVIVHTQNFWTKFSSISNILLSADMDLENADEKADTFFTQKQKRKNTDKKRIPCKFIFITAWYKYLICVLAFWMLQKSNSYTFTILNHDFV